MPRLRSSNLYIFDTWWCKPLIFKIQFSRIQFNILRFNIGLKRNIYSKNKRSDNLFHPSIDLWYIKQITNIKSLQFVFKEIGVKKSEFRTRLQFQFAFFIYIYIAHIYLKDIYYKAQQRQGFNARKVIPEVYAFL